MFDSLRNLRVNDLGIASAPEHQWSREPRFGVPALDSLLREGEEPRLGTHILCNRRRYFHHGIYVGGGRVVHYAGFAYGLSSGPVEEVSLREFANNRPIWLRRSALPAFSPDEVVRRARSRLGENRYQLLRNNCEHFCEWCLHGEPRSFQVECLSLFAHLLLATLLSLRALARPIWRLEIRSLALVEGLLGAAEGRSAASRLDSSRYLV